MSSNTNTLFWVITGAVVVLGIFLLTNNSSDNSIKTITNKFDGIYNEQVSKLDNTENDTNEDIIGGKEDEPSIEEEVIAPLLISDMNKLEEFMKVSDKPYCKDHQVLDSRFDVEFGYYKDDVLKFSVLNKSGGTLRNVRVNVDLYDCETDEQILGCFVTEDYFYSNDISTWFCMPGTGKEFKGESWYSITTAEVRG